MSESDIFVEEKYKSFFPTLLYPDNFMFMVYNSEIFFIHENEWLNKNLPFRVIFSKRMIVILARKSLIIRNKPSGACCAKNADEVVF